jgi:uncharacterized protein
MPPSPTPTDPDTPAPLLRHALPGLRGFGRPVDSDPAVDGGPLVLGGRSAGARVACRTAGTLGADAVCCLAFPLYPPGRPDKSRASELPIALPTLVVQGRRDAFGGPDEISAVAPRNVHVVPVDGDHGMRSAAASVAAAVVGWLGQRAG